VIAILRPLLCLALLSAALPPTFLRAESLTDVLARMDQAAADFRSLTAKMKRLQYTAVLSESTEMEGVVRLRRDKAGITGIVEFQKPDPRTVFIKGKTVQIFYPKANSVEEYDTSKYVSNIDQFLLLGFGTTSAELRKSYDIKSGAVETVAGVRATRLELTARSADLKKLVTKIELWFPEGQANPIQEKVTEPSNNYELVNYADIIVNPSLPDSAYQLKLPSGVKKIYPQK
jgi:outer membrane lipoprotein-sorting protein